MLFDGGICASELILSDKTSRFNWKCLVVSDGKVGKPPDPAVFTGLLVFLLVFFLALFYENFQTEKLKEEFHS